MNAREGGMGKAVALGMAGPRTVKYVWRAAGAARGEQTGIPPVARTGHQLHAKRVLPTGGGMPPGAEWGRLKEGGGRGRSPPPLITNSQLSFKI